MLLDRILVNTVSNFDRQTALLLVPFAPYFHKIYPCILDGWPLCVEWASIGTTIAPLGSL